MWSRGIILDFTNGLVSLTSCLVPLTETYLERGTGSLRSLSGCFPRSHTVIRTKSLKDLLNPFRYTMSYETRSALQTYQALEILLGQSQYGVLLHKASSPKC